jgi:integrase/recombinase XerD
MNVTLERLWHKEKDCLAVKFKYDVVIANQIRKFDAARWSYTHKAWLLPYSQHHVNEVCKLLNNEHSIIFKDDLKAIEIPKTNKELQLVNALAGLNEDTQKKVKEFENWMQSKRYSSSTIGTYTDALKTFLRFYANKAVSEINNNDVIIFNNEYILKNKFSASYQNQVVNAIKLFFKTIELKSMETELVHRPKRALVLPNVLSKQEIKLILTAQKNIKHKTMLSLIYSCGLRRSELLNLKLKDIDSKRGLVIIRQAKGKKDRITPLSEKILVLLREYFVAYSPKEWLFEGQSGVGQYDERSLASVLKQALEKSKINKPVTLHWLRHSYATHLLENGTDLRYIQEILGHSRSTTTEIYTHVSNKSIQKVISPFDSL